MKRISVIVFTLLFSFAACTAKPPPEAPPEAPPAAAAQPDSPAPASAATTPTAAEGFSFTAENMPLIDGSTATIPLIGAVYSVLLGLPRVEADAMVSTSGTDNAYIRLIVGEADILLAYSPSPDSLEYARNRAVELEMAPIGRDGLVFLVNKVNPVQSLTPQQIVSIYDGSMVNWKEAGGDAADIKAFQRPLRSGSQTMMDELVMKGVPMMDTESTYVIGEMGGLIEAIASFDHAESSIGYNVYYFVSQMEMNENVRMLAVGGVAPTTGSIEDGSYPFVSDFYAVIRKDAAPDSPERILYDWMLSGDGQSLVRYEGYAGLGAR